MTSSSSESEFDTTPVTIEEEMERSYLDYAMSVIVSRALPDVRDGLKPVHRRILFAMKEAGYDHTKPHRKSARIVGDVMGKYHPHGDTAIYDAMVRMAQDFSLRLPLVDGQGNFGSMDGDPPAAMRYTEARLARSAETLLRDIDKDTVDYQANYDDTSVEPMVLPAEYPNLLVNGAGGIAVGMATNIPPHNLGEVVDACMACIDDPGIGLDKLMALVPGPDFPTGGIILGRGGIVQAYGHGRGSLMVRARTRMEERPHGREAIIVSEIPYQVNKSRMIERIAEVVRDKQVEGISDLRDESDRDGVRVVIELRRDVSPEVVLNQLYRYTPLQTSFGVNMLALDGGRPVMMGLRRIIDAFVTFREEVITRRTVYQLGRARDRAHLLIGLALSVVNLDAVIKLIRAAKSPAEAREQLVEKPWSVEDVGPLIELVDEPGRGIKDGHYSLSEEQAKAILELRLHRLTGLEREKIGNDLKDLVSQIADFLDILGSRERLLSILRDELSAVKEQFANPRRTTLEEGEFVQDIESLIEREDMVVTFSHRGYIKRVPLSTYRAQRRGGKGRAGMATREEDFVHQVFVVNTHTPVLFFSTRGMVYKMKVYKLPLGTPQARGKPLVNMLPLAGQETISTLMPLPEDEDTWDNLFVVFATSSGSVRRNRLSDFTNVMANGKIAMKLDNGDALVGVMTCDDGDDVLLSTRNGKCIRFPVTDVRVFSGRTSTGVRGVKLEKDDEIISMSTLRNAAYGTDERDEYLRASRAKHRLEGAAEGAPDVQDRELAQRLSDGPFAEMAAREEFILTVTENGYGKRSSAYEYRASGRGGKGVVNIETSRRNGPVVASFPIGDRDQIMLVTDGGKLIRMPIDDVRIAGRATQGVTLFRVAEGENVVSVTRLAEDDGQNGESQPDTVSG